MSNKHHISHEQADELIDQLYKESSNELPGKDLDSVILNKAKNELNNTQSRGNYRINWQRYSSLAASLVVVITIGMIYYDNDQLVQPESAIMIKQETIATDEVLSERSMGAETPIAEDEMPFKEQEHIAEEMIHAERLENSSSVDAERAEMSVAPKSAAVGKLEANKESQSALKKTKPKPSKAIEPRALMAPMTVHEDAKVQQKAKAVGSDDSGSLESSYALELELLIREIRVAIDENDRDTAEKLYKTFKEEFPNEAVPADISAFFSNDL